MINDEDSSLLTASENSAVHHVIRGFADVRAWPLLFVALGAFPVLALCADTSRWDLKGLTPYELLTLKEIATLSISPDGSKVAFVTRQAVLESNSYRCDLYVMDATEGSVPRLLGPIIPRDMVNGFTENRLHWADGNRLITFIAKFDSRPQVWVWDLSGGPPRRVSDATTDVLSHDVLPDGKTIFFTTLAAKAGEREQERLRKQVHETGMLFDPTMASSGTSWGEYRGSDGVNRYVLQRTGMQYEHWLFNIDTGRTRRVTRDELAAFPAALGFPGAEDLDVGEIDLRFGTSPSTGQKHFVSPDGKRTVTRGYRIDAGQRFFSVRVAGARGENPVDWYRETEIGASFAWEGDGSTVLFSQDSHDDVGLRSGIYRIASPGSVPVPVFTSTDTMSHITFTEDATRAAYLQSNATQPERVSMVDLTSGQHTILYDPNPEFAERRLDKPTYLKWVNKYRVGAFGYLVKPLNYERGKKYPLVVVVYIGKGFLRGGTGDEYPIYPLAAQGFAVLVLDKGNAYIFPSEGDDFANFSRQWSAKATFEEALRRADGFDFVDSTRRAVTGLSYGASAAWYAIAASDLFQVAIVSDGGYGPFSLYLSGRNSAAHWLGRVLRVPLYTREVQDRWKRVGIAFNVDRIRAPVLINDSDSEFDSGLEVTSTMTGLGKPFEMFVYAGANHNINQPAQRYSIYNRNIDWLRFWLNGEEDPSPDKRDQYARWHRLRAQHDWNEAHIAKGRNPAQIYFEQSGALSREERIEASKVAPALATDATLTDRP